ncbi:MAG: GAF domain-containing protein [Nitrospirae bacterium]|nr:MAG: GAF domain-containing protein [Nitrospirota bacterium]
MNFFAFSGLVNGLAATGLALLVYRRAPHDLRHQTFGRFGLAVAFWSYGYCGWQLAGTREAAVWWVHILTLGAIWIPVSYLHHVLALLNRIHLSRRFLRINYALAVAFSLISFTPFFIRDYQPEAIFPFWPKAGILFHPFLLWWGGLAIWAIVLLYTAFRRETGFRRVQLLYVLIGSTVGYLGGATNFPLWYDIPILPYGTILITFYIATVAYTLLRYRLMGFSLALEKGLAYLVLMVLIALPIYPVLLILQKLFFGVMSTQFSVIQLALFLLTVIGAYKMKTTTADTISRTLFRERYQVYETLSRFSKALISILDVHTLTNTIVNTLGETMQSRTVVLYLLDKQRALYYPAATFGFSPQDSATLPSFCQTDVLPCWLRDHQAELVREELEHGDHSDPSGMSQLLLDLIHIRTSVCLPLIHQHRLLGFCGLGPRTTQTWYSPHDVEVLMVLAREAAIAIDNALVYQEVKESRTAIRRTDRLRSLETMASGLAQEIRLPLASIRAFIEQAPQRCDDQVFLQQVALRVMNDVTRIEHHIKEILDYARQIEPRLTLEDLNELIESCLHLTTVHPTPRPIRIEKSLAPDLPRSWIDRQQIKQVLLNILLQSLEAIRETGGVLRVRTHELIRSSGDRWLVIEVSDTGSGISTVERNHLFDPFFHQEHNAQPWRLGLVIANQIIHEHQGYLEVSSEIGKGTTFIINLPLRSASTGSHV